MSKDLKFLTDFLNTPSPSGYEDEACSFLIDSMAGVDGVAFKLQDKMKNVAFRAGRNGGKGKRVMISGHIDENALQVQYITSSGFINFVNLGGIDRKTLVGEHFSVLTDFGIYVDGVIGKKPIHVETEESRNKIEKLCGMFLDVGAKSKDEVLDMGIRPGSIIIYKKENCIPEFGPKKDLIVAQGLDDKIGVYVTMEVLKRVNKKRLLDKDISVFGVAMTQEEVGLRGSETITRQLNPDVSIDIDVTISTDKDLEIEKAKYGDVELGKGVVIEYGPDKSARIANELVKICKKEEIPYQLASSRAGGTNTSRIQTSAVDCETMLLSIPCRNLHTQVEMCSWVDIEACINLITAYLEK